MTAHLFSVLGEPVASIALDGFVEILVVNGRTFMYAPETRDENGCGYRETTGVILDGVQTLA